MAPIRIFVLVLAAKWVIGAAALSQTTDAVLYLNRCAEEVEKNAFKAALVDCTKSIELNPSNAVAYTNRSAAKQALGDFEGAIADATKAIGMGFSGGYFNRDSARASKGEI